MIFGFAAYLARRAGSTVPLLNEAFVLLRVLLLLAYCYCKIPMLLVLVTRDWLMLWVDISSVALPIMDTLVLKL